MSPDPYLNCPFEKVHRILKSRMQTHLVKCMKHHTLLKKIVCPFNTTHIIDGVEFEHHIKTCPDSGVVLNYQYSLEPLRQLGTVSAEEAANQPTPSSNENWDDEPPAATYDPLQNIENKNVLRILMVQSKAEKKKFRNQERQRFSSMDEKHASSSVAKSTKKNLMFLEEPLRSPRRPAKALSQLNINDEQSNPTATEKVKPMILDIKKPKQEHSSDSDGNSIDNSTKTKRNIQIPRAPRKKEENKVKTLLQDNTNKFEGHYIKSETQTKYIRAMNTQSPSTSNHKYWNTSSDEEGEVERNYCYIMQRLQIERDQKKKEKEQMQKRSNIANFSRGGLQKQSALRCSTGRGFMIANEAYRKYHSSETEEMFKSQRAH